MAQTQAPSTLLMLVHFHNWANLGLLDYCAAHEHEIGDEFVVGLYGTVRDTWVHVAVAESEYLGAFGEPLVKVLPFRPRRGDFPGFAELRGAMERSGEALVRISRDVPGERMIAGEYGGEPFENVPASIFLSQAIAHAADHRSQIKVALTQAGLEPPEFDLWHFVEQDTDA